MNAYEAKMQASDMCYVCFESRHTGACARANCPQARRVPRKAPDFAEEAPATPVSYKQTGDICAYGGPLCESDYEPGVNRERCRWCPYRKDACVNKEHVTATEPTVPTGDMVTLSNIRCEHCKISLAPAVAKNSKGMFTCSGCGWTHKYDIREFLLRPDPTDRALANHFEKYPGALPDLDQEPPHADEAAYREQVMGLLAERQTTHGNFTDNARIAQWLRRSFRGEYKGWDNLSEREREALDQIAGKLSRILSGQGGFADHWEDIAGYATLAANPEVQ